MECRLTQNGRSVVRRLEKETPFEGDYDVAIIGLGTAGAAAFRTAATEGLKVIGIEKYYGMGELSTLGIVCFGGGLNQRLDNALGACARGETWIDHGGKAPRPIYANRPFDLTLTAKDYSEKVSWLAGWRHQNWMSLKKNARMLRPSTMLGAREECRAVTEEMVSLADAIAEKRFPNLLFFACEPEDLPVFYNDHAFESEEIRNWKVHCGLPMFRTLHQDITRTAEWWQGAIGKASGTPAECAAYALWTAWKCRVSGTKAEAKALSDRLAAAMSKDERYAGNYAIALGLMKDVRALSVLREIVNHPGCAKDPIVKKAYPNRIKALDMLRIFKDCDSVPLLRKIVRDGAKAFVKGLVQTQAFGSDDRTVFGFTAHVCFAIVATGYLFAWVRGPSGVITRSRSCRVLTKNFTASTGRSTAGTPLNT